MAVTIEIVTSSSRIVTPDGVNGWGQITIYPNQPFTYVDGVTPYSVSAAAQQIAIADGQLQSALNLAPNTGATNVPETHYLAVIDVSGYKWTEYWQIDNADADPTEYTSVTRLTGPDSAETDIAEHVRQVNPHTQYMRFSDATAVQSGATVTDGGGKIARLDPVTEKIPGTLIDTETTPVTDTGGYFTGTLLEDVLQEIGAGIGYDPRIAPTITSEETEDITDADQLNRVINLKIEGPISSGTAGEITGASYNGTSLNVGTDGLTAPLECVWGNDGLRLYGISLADTVYQYTLTTAYDLSTATFDYSHTFTVTGNLHGLAFNIEGTKVFLLGHGGDVHEYSLGTAWAISSAAASETSSTTVPTTFITQGRGLFFSTDGLTMLIGELSTAVPAVLEYVLGTAFDMSGSVGYVDKLDLSGEETQMTSFAMNSDGTRLFSFSQTGTPGDTVFQYNLSTGFDMSTGAYATKSQALNSAHTSPTGMALKPDGTKFVLCDSTLGYFYEYDIVKTFAGQAISWCAGFNWTAAGAATATRYGSGPINNLDCAFRGLVSTSGALETTNLFQILVDDTSGPNREHVIVKTPNGTTWADFVVLDVGIEINGGGAIQDEIVRLAYPSDTELNIYLVDAGTVNPQAAFAGSIQIGRVRDL